MTAPADEAAYQWAISRHVHNLRERAATVATARLSGTDDTAAVTAYLEHLEQFDDPGLLRDVLAYVIWYGGRSAETTACDRLARLRDAHDVTPVLEVIDRA